jgi:hypothetical protein
VRRVVILSVVLLLLVLEFSFSFLSSAQNNDEKLLKDFLDIPAPAPLNPLFSMRRNANTKVSREPEFYKKNNIPPDDAPIEDLLDYWSKQSANYRELGYNVKPTDKTTERLLEYCEDNHLTLLMLINIIPGKPKFAEVIKQIYDVEMQNKTPNTAFIYPVRRWLVYKSNYFSDELLKSAQKVKDQNEYVTYQDDLIALTRVDWEKAQPILDRLINDPTQPVAATLAKWCYYIHALETENNADIEKYRRQLMDIVEDRKALPGARDLAFDALVKEPEWDGRDDWYITLLEDETLFELRVNGQLYTGLTTLLIYSPPEKWIPQMLRLVGSKNEAVHNAAVKNLIMFLNEENPDVLRALLPWVTNPKWAKEVQSERRNLIIALGSVSVPESIPALISLVTSEDENAIYAAQSLGFYKDSRAVPALRTALSKASQYDNRRILINSLIACGGLTDDEQVNALVAFATMISTPEGLQKYQQYENNYYEEEEYEETPPIRINRASNTVNTAIRAANSYSEKFENEAEITPVPLIISIGSFVAEQTEPSAGIVVRIIQREKALRKSKPQVADTLAEIMRKWKGAAIFIERLNHLREGLADLEMILTVLADREEMREKIPNEILALRGANGIAGGLAACLSEEETVYGSVLAKPDDTAKTAMLGCARLIRAKLSVTEIGGYLNSPNKLLALSAERYLESEDSLEARRLILAKRPNEALILGARRAFVWGKGTKYSEVLTRVFQSTGNQRFADFEYTEIISAEEKLRKELLENPDLLVIYGLLPNLSEGQQVVRVYKNKVTFTFYEDEARYLERTLTSKEYEDFTRFLTDENVDSYAPFSFDCYGCPATEFVMFGRNGGRRVFYENPYANVPQIAKIIEQFKILNQGELKLNYNLANKIQNLEVLLADKKLSARAVWKNGDDLRVLIEDTEKEAEIEQNLEEQFRNENAVETDDNDDNGDQNYQRYLSQNKRRQEVAFDHYSWRKFANGKLGEITEQPLNAQVLIDETQFPFNEEFVMEPRAWQVKSGIFEIRVSYEKSGLYKVSRSQAPIKILDGYFSSPIVTADGNWAVVSKLNSEEEKHPIISRVNLQTGKEFPVNLPPSNTFLPIAFVPSHNKILVMRSNKPRYYGEYESSEEDSDKSNPSPKTPEYHLLDANSGVTQPVKGDFRPLEQQTYRPLQLTSLPNEFWAAVYDETAKETVIGRYNTKTFALQTITKLPEIKLDSMSIWVDEPQGKIYFVYQGHLLAVPLKS